MVADVIKHKLVSNVLSLYALQGLNYLVPLITLPYILRVLGPRSFGLIALAQAVIGYAAILVEYGFNLSSARDVSIARDNPMAVSKIYWTTVATKLFLLIVTTVILAIVIALVPDLRHDWRLFALSGASILGNVVFPIWFLQGLERLREAAFAQALAKIIITASIYIFVKSSNNLLIAAFLMASTPLASTIVAIVLRIPLRPAHLYFPKISDIRATLANSWHMFLGNLSTTAYGQTNILVLGFMCDTRAAGYYSFAYRLIQAIQGLSSPITQAIFPQASVLFVTEPKSVWPYVRRLAWILLPPTFFVSLLLLIFTPQIVVFIGGDAFINAVPIIRIMSILPILISTATILGFIVMMNIGLSNQLMRIYMLIALVNVCLLPYLVKNYAAVGASLALVIAETCGPIAMYLVLRKKVPRVS